MRFWFVLIMLVSLSAKAQETDSVAVSTDTLETSVYSALPDDHAAADTTTIARRQFDAQTLHKLRADPELQYTAESTVGESLWQRFLRWINDWILSLFDAATSTNWGRVFAYAFLFISLVVVVLMILKVNTMRVFYGDGASPLTHHVIDEDIHSMDFDRLVRDALNNQDYRLAVRLIFLHALKILSDKNHIQWSQGKTNHDYLNELKGGDLKNGFNELNYFFEYAWYGNFTVTDGVYARVRKAFDEWRIKA